MLVDELDQHFKATSYATDTVVGELLYSILLVSLFQLILNLMTLLHGCIEIRI